MTTLRQALDRHWFAPASLRDLAIVRIVVVGAQLYFLSTTLTYQLWLAQIDPSFYLPIPAQKVLLLAFGWGARPEPMLLEAAWMLGVVSGLSALVGLYTRLSLFCFAAVNTLLVAHGYSYGEVHHPEALMIMVLWILAFAPAGEAWSLDDLRFRMRSAFETMRFEPQKPEDIYSPLARWPLRLAQWMFVLVYLSAGMSKLANGGLEWFNGYTLAFYFAQDGVRHGGLGLYLASYPTVCAVLAVGTVVFELTFVLAVLVPGLAWAYVMAGTVFLGGIYLIQRAPFFGYIFLYIVFIEALRRRINLAPKRVAPAWTLIYDGLCPLCVRSMVFLDYLDARRRLRFVDLERDWSAAAATVPGLTQDEARHAMHLVGPDGEVYRGFFAFRALARLLPLMWPLLPLLHGPVASRLGQWSYSIVAGSRGRTVCRAAKCNS